jgi:uncharacterized protein (TIGR00725 family)
MLQIGVIGAGKASENELDAAELIGAEIARKGHILVCGGLGGVMEAASKGAKSKGGLTIGILPGEDKSEANEYTDVKVVTAMSHGRNAIISRTADVLIAVGGGTGTLSEIGLSMKIEKPVIFIKNSLPEFIVEGEKIYQVDEPWESVELAEKLLLSKKGVRA